MVTLNLDCWRIVFEQLEPETRALYNCLFVSKEFFTLSTRVIYRRPLQVFEGQRQFSSFSRGRLANLLGICTGFIVPSTTATAVDGNQQTRPSSRSSSPTTTTSTVTTTINYYKLVLEYPAHLTIRLDHASRWPEYLKCFAETMTFFHVSAQDFNLILPLVSRFRVLNSVFINSRPPPTPPPSSPSLSRSSPTSSATAHYDEYLVNVVKFIRLHRQAFPGVLTKLDTSSLLTNWKESAEVQDAIGGMVQQTIVMKQDVQQDLSGLVVSRLKTLMLFCHNETGLEIKAMELLKRCRVLETLDIGWTQGVVMDWSKLLLSKEDDDDHEQGAGYGGQEGSTLPVVYSVKQKQQPPQQLQQRTRFGLKHLIVWGNVTMTLRAMEIFKDTLESIEIRWNHNFTPRDSFLDWKKAFILPRLKSIELCQANLGLDNLIACCPRLERLALMSNENKTRSTWSTISSTTFLFPITLRKLELKYASANGFDMTLLKPLKNLDELYLGAQEVGRVYKRLPNIKMVKDDGWWFPKLKSVTLFERFSVQVQGQVLWVAPKLESLTLEFGTRYKIGPLDMDTFLFPPRRMDIEVRMVQLEQGHKVDESENIQAITAATPLSSEACFPALKSLKLDKFCFSNRQMTAEAFGDAFFGPRRKQSSPSDNTDNNNNRNDIDSRDGIGNKDYFLFPNLEQLELCWDQPQNAVQACVLPAMNNMPNLQRIRYSELLEQARFNDTLAEWLQEVPGDKLGLGHGGYRHRPLPAETTLTTEGGPPTILVMNRCVVEFDRPRGIRYQLRAPSQKSQNPVGLREKVRESKIWRRLFSRSS